MLHCCWYGHPLLPRLICLHRCICLLLWLLLIPSVPPDFAPGSAVDLPEDTPFPGMQWATVKSLGTTGASQPSSSERLSQLATEGPAFSVTPVSSCEMLADGPRLNITGFLSFSLVEDGFGSCSFDVSLCDGTACSSSERLEINVAEGETHYTLVGAAFAVVAGWLSWPFAYGAQHPTRRGTPTEAHILPLRLGGTDSYVCTCVTCSE